MLPRKRESGPKLLFLAPCNGIFSGARSGVFRDSHSGILNDARCGALSEAHSDAHNGALSEAHSGALSKAHYDGLSEALSGVASGGVPLDWMVKMAPLTVAYSDSQSAINGPLTTGNLSFTSGVNSSPPNHAPSITQEIQSIKSTSQQILCSNLKGTDSMNFTFSPSINTEEWVSSWLKKNAEVFM